ncbi:MAG: TfoX/Sxy family protein [Fimbriimonadaceae bacterium]
MGDLRKDVTPVIYRPVRYEIMMKAAEKYDVRARRMFGGMGIYTGEKMFAFLFEEDIGLKLSPDDLAEAMNLPGAGPVQPDPNVEPMREYVRLPKEVVEDYELFVHWVERSANYARRRLAQSNSTGA